MKRQLIITGALLLSLVLALIGQYLLPNVTWTRLGGAYFGVAALALVWVLLIEPVGALVGVSDVARPFPSSLPLLPLNLFWRVILIGITGLLAVYAFLRLGENQFTPDGTAAWLAAILCFGGSFAHVPTGWWAKWQQRWLAWRARHPWTRSVWGWRVRRRHVLWLAIFLLAVFFRFYRLNTLPADMTSDQAEKLYDVFDVLSGQRPIFFPRNTGREAMQFYLTALLIRLTGAPMGYLPLKVGTGLVGLAALPWMYLWARELYGRFPAFLATFFLATSSWHVAISRVGLRFPFTAAFATPALWFLFRAFKYNRRNDWLAAGFMLGVGLHTYIPMRMVPLLFLVLCGVKLLLDGWAWGRKRPLSSPLFPETTSLTWRFWQNAVLGGLMSVLLFLPLLRYMYDDPGMFWYRVTTRSLDGGNALPGESLQILADNVKNALLMFNYRGDPVVTNGIPWTPFLGWVSGALFVLGVVYLLWQGLRHGDRRSLYLLLTLFILLLPSILSLEFPKENPSRVRTGGAIPVAMLIAALPLAVIGQYWQQFWSRRGKWLMGLVTAVLLLLGVRDDYTYYFIRYDAHIRNTLWNTVEMGTVARGFADSLGDMGHVYHVPYPYWADTRLIGLEAGVIPWQNAVSDPNEIQRQHLPDPAAKLYILHPQDTANLQALFEIYPQGWSEYYVSAVPAGKDFVLFFVPPR